MRISWTSKYLAELLGTFGLVFFGTGSIVVNDSFDGAITHTGISLAFGLIVMAMIYTFGKISGAHINPAVTISFWLAGEFPGKRVVGYAIAQCAGAILASFVLQMMFPLHAGLGLTAPSGTVLQSFLLEVLLTFFLMLVIIHVATGAKEEGVMAGASIGGTVLLAALAFGPVSGASMNPARSLGPALVSGEVSHLWLYFVAPVIGGALSIAAWRLTIMRE